MKSGTYAALCLALFASGCATTKPAENRDEVGDILAERGGPQDVISSKQDEQSRAAIEDRVEALLRDPITSDRAVQIAVLNNRELRVTLEDLGVAQADLVQAGLLQNPTLGLELVGSTKGNGLGGGFGISQSLLSAFLIPAKRRVAKAQLRQTVVVVADATLGLVRDVKVAYAELRRAVDSAELARVMTQTAEVANDLATLQHEAGNIADLDRELFAADLDHARLQLAEHQLEVVHAREHINVLLGLWGKQLDWRLAQAQEAPKVEESALANLETLGVEQRLDVSAARAQVESVTYALELRRRGVIPNVEVGLVGRNEVGTDAGHEWVLGPELSLEIPIFDPGHADFAKLQAYVRGAQHQLEQTAVMARAEIRTERMDLVTATRKLAYLQETVLPRRQTVGARAAERYNAMLLSAYDLLELRAEQAEVQEEFIEARRDVEVALAELERAVGGKLPASE